MNVLTHARLLALVKSIEVIGITTAPAPYETFTVTAASVVIIPSKRCPAKSSFAWEVAPSKSTAWKIKTEI